jgi:hypothetical protein
VTSSPAHDPSDRGGPDLWDSMPLVPPVKPPTPPAPEEFVWSKPERLKDPPPDAAPATPARRASRRPPKPPTSTKADTGRSVKKAAKGRPVKKAAKRVTRKRSSRP